MNLLILAFANEKNILSENLENSLIKYEYNYKIIGEGLKWVNFMTKIKTCYDFIIQTDYDLIAIIDAYDVIACDGPDVLIKKFLKFDKDIVVGAENYCGGNCIPLDRYYEKTKREKGPYMYANGGFYIGYKKNILSMLKYILSLGISDDQIGLGRYINKYPYDICLDGNGTLISNVVVSSYFDTYYVDNRVKNIKTKEYPCFIHTPGIQLDLYNRMDYFGKKVLGKKYKKYTSSEKFSCFYNKCKGKISQFYQTNFILFLIIFLTFLFLIIYIV